MAAYNLVNGVKSTLSGHLLNDILRGDFNFQGFVLSDWWAMPPGTASATPNALQGYGIQGVNAGMDMELPWSYDYQQLEGVTGPGEPLNQHQLAISAARIIRQKFRFNVEELSSPGIGLKSPSTTMDSLGSIANNDAHIADAEQSALESMVLLQNDGTLPINTTTVHNVAVIGAKVPFSVPGAVPNGGVVDFANTVRLGDYGSSRVWGDPAKSTSPFQGIQKQGGPLGVNVAVGNSDTDVPANTNLIVAVVGLTPEDEGEEYTLAGDRKSFDLDGKFEFSNPPRALIQNPMMLGDPTINIVGLIPKAKAMGIPIVVVVEAGANIDMPWLSQVNAVVMAWYPGQQGGDALGQLLFGKANFSGKLPFTWPAQWTDEPPFASGTLTDSYYIGYAWFDNMKIKPLYAFGYGMSYTKFAYSNLSIPCSSVTSSAVVPVTVDITNTGTVQGDETAFLFVSYPQSPPNVRRPLKQVKSFARVSLMPGETQRVSLPVRVADLKYWDMVVTNSWQPASGPVQVLVGPSSDNLPLTATFNVQ